jgi:hypothetical protein
VNQSDARRIALSLPEAVEQDHHGRPSFRVAGEELLADLLAGAHGRNPLDTYSVQIYRAVICRADIFHG